MSRCFPYPPPGYCRNGASYEALIESIKLQKETDKAKAERKKEKRAKKEKKEKNDKEKKKRKNDEKVKLQNIQSQDSHKLQKVAVFTEGQIKGTKTNPELLERSDLTEDHGPPINPCYSSDSTQNSNKRRRDDDDDVLLPDDSTGHGKPFKILILKKHKGPNPSSSGEDARLKAVPSVQPSNFDRTLPISSNRNNGVPATSGRENNAVQGIPLTKPKPNTSFEKTKYNNQNWRGRDQSASSSAANLIFPSGSIKSDAELLKSSRQQQQIASFVRPVVPQSHLEHELPSTSLSRNIGVQGLNYGRQQQGPSNSKPGILDPVLNKPNPSATGKRPVNEITVPGSSDGPAKLEKEKEDAHKAGPTRYERKMLKKQAKYEKLIGSWVPPVFQALLPDVDDDWLSRSTTVKSSTSREVEISRELAPTSLWQPRAQILVEADTYALPYTVLF